MPSAQGQLGANFFLICFTPVVMKMSGSLAVKISPDLKVDGAPKG
jgi:hypothetical protein